MMQETIIKSKIKFIGTTSWDCYYIWLEGDTFTIESLTLKEANQIIKEADLSQVLETEEGSVFASKEFKETLNSNKQLKQIILDYLEKIE